MAELKKQYFEFNMFAKVFGKSAKFIFKEFLAFNVSKLF